MKFFSFFLILFTINSWSADTLPTGVPVTCEYSVDLNTLVIGLTNPSNGQPINFDSSAALDFHSQCVSAGGFVKYSMTNINQVSISLKCAKCESYVCEDDNQSEPSPNYPVIRKKGYRR